jgi:hypothetical protein
MILTGEQSMTYEDILKILAPCGLNCSKCLMYANGDIKELSIRLQDLLGNFERYAERFSSFQPVFKNYPQFKELLSHLTGGACTGCRSGACRYPGCQVFPCTREKGIDFCFQCPDFPCTRVTFDPDLKRRWQEMNGRMKEIGVQAYYEETRDLPRYR